MNYSKKELEKQLFDLKHELFFLEMKDHWDNADFSYSNKLNQEIRRLEDEIKKLV